HRLWPGAEGWFTDTQFCIACSGTLPSLLSAAQSCRFAPYTDGPAGEADPDEDDSRQSKRAVQPLVIESPIRIGLDWWSDKSIKTWAGSMKVNKIATAMSNAIDPRNQDPFNQRQV